MKPLLRRLAWSVGVVWAVVSMVFVLSAVLPGNPARLAAGPQARPADVARIGHMLGLDRPVPIRYVVFWRRLVHFGPRSIDPSSETHATCAVAVPLGATSIHVDLGKSFQLQQPVVDAVGERLPRTFYLAVAALMVQLLIGVASGTLAASRPGSWLDRGVVSAGVLGVSAPTFLIALALQYLVAYRLRWLPLDGFGETPSEHVLCLVLPALTLGIYGGAYYTRLVRDEVAGLMRSGWVRTARAKGLSGWRVLVVHALRNGLLPVVTAAALDFGDLLGGAVVTETVFRWPGLGDLGVKAMRNRDGPVIVACVIVTSLGVVLANLLADLAYNRLDPRVSGQRGRDSR
jgi:peptide/nickel transport system permease protein